MVSGVERGLPRPARPPDHRQPRAHRARWPAARPAVPLVDAHGRARSASTPPAWPTASTWRCPPTPRCAQRVDALVRGESAAPARARRGPGARPTSPASSARRSACRTARACSCARSRDDSPAAAAGDQDRRPAHPGRPASTSRPSTTSTRARRPLATADELTLHARPGHRRARPDGVVRASRRGARRGSDRRRSSAALRRGGRRSAGRPCRCGRCASPARPGPPRPRASRPSRASMPQWRSTTGTRIWSWWTREVVDAGLGDRLGVGLEVDDAGAGHLEGAHLALDGDHHAGRVDLEGGASPGPGRRGSGGSRRSPPSSSPRSRPCPSRSLPVLWWAMRVASSWRAT